MSTLTAVIIDSNEPKWVQELKFKHTAPNVASLHVGDAWLTTDDATTIIVERKSASDLLNSVLDDGLRNQAVRMANEAMFQWQYIVYTMPEIRGEFVVINSITSKVRWRRILGVLVDCQEMGVTCVPIASDAEYAGTLEWLATRNHGNIKAQARRKGILETDEEHFLSGLPGIQERASSLMDNFEAAAWVLDWLCNMNTEYKVRGIADGTKRRVRTLLGLADDERLGVINQEWEFIAGTNRQIDIGEGDDAGHIWADDGGMAAIVKLLSDAMPDDPRLKELLKGEPQNE